MYSCSHWDGLAKIGEFQTPHGSVTTPALFPVVDPKLQSIPIQDMRDKFGFDQVITSTYLMSKRIGHDRWMEYPQVHEYLDFDGVVMMDSGAYQIMLYGDIELGVVDTLRIQEQVLPDIGVLMDHPIGYDVNQEEATKRNETTLANIRTSLPHLSDNIAWTLPIQGGKYKTLLRQYLETVTKEKYFSSFDFYALGSVVPIMIRQDYSTLVEMISLSRKFLPVTRPLHLFGAGHPAMFALATFLGCDTFDSAAYVLMAKEHRYMTVEGTYDLADLSEFPCACQVCMNYTPKEIRGMEKNERMKNLSMHNLWVSSAEIRRIRLAIKDGNLWDLVNERAHSVPYLARATRQALGIVTNGELQGKYHAGISVSSSKPIRISRRLDLDRVEITRIKNQALEFLKHKQPHNLILVAYDLTESIYNKLPDDQLNHLEIPDNTLVGLVLPAFGIVPLGLTEIYPVGQIVCELGVDAFSPNLIKKQLVFLDSLTKITIITTFPLPDSMITAINQHADLEVIDSYGPVSTILSLLE